MPDEHSLLSASTAHRWLECTPSARLEQLEEGECSVYAEEGTEAHAYAELLLNYKLNKISEEDFLVKKQAFLSDSKYFNQEFNEYVMSYVDYVMKRVIEIGKENCKTYIECKVNFSNIVPQGFGTADMLIVTDTSIIVIDLKFGTGVPVSVKGNPQLRLYAVGALNLFPNSTDVEMVIFQPRLNSIDSDVMSKKDILDWAVNYVVPRADEAIQGTGKLNAGEKQCRFCKLRGKCKARADMQLGEAQREFAIPTEKNIDTLSNTLSNEQLGKILSTAPLFIEWFNDIEKYALHQMLNGAKIPGYKLVEGRSSRVITDPDAVESVLKEVVLTKEMIYEEPKLKGISKLEAIVGKKLFQNLCGEYMTKPAGKVTIAKEDDARPEISTLAIAQREFADAIDYDNKENS